MAGLRIDKCCLAIIDIQGKLAQLMYDKHRLFRNSVILLKTARILQIPILYTQQCPENLGPTIPQIAKLLSDCEPINKATFSCCGHEQFNDKLSGLNRRQVLLCGIEAHICIYQTAVDLIENGWDVSVIADAVSSRKLQNKEIALSKLAHIGTNIISTEMLVFELLKTAEHPKFKQIAKLIK